MSVSPLIDHWCGERHHHQVFATINQRQHDFQPETYIRLEVTQNHNARVFEQVILSSDAMRQAIHYPTVDFKTRFVMERTESFVRSIYDPIVTQYPCLRSEPFWMDLVTDLFRGLGLSLGVQAETPRIGEPRIYSLPQHNEQVEYRIGLMREWVHYKYHPEDEAPQDNIEITYDPPWQLRVLREEQDRLKERDDANLRAETLFKQMFPTLDRTKLLGVKSKLKPDMVYVFGNPTRVYVFRKMQKWFGIGPEGWNWVGHLCIVFPGGEPPADQYTALLLRLRDDERAVWAETYAHGGVDMDKLWPEMGGVGGFRSEPPRQDFWPNCVATESWLY